MSAVSRLLLGRPLPDSADSDQRLGRLAAVGAFGLDALSSVAYGPDEILYVLLLAGSSGLALDLPVAIAITALLAVVALSYRQTIYAYPRGGGSFTVASDNLGRGAGMIAAAALMVDYLTTVAVSVTAGIAAIVAFWPALNSWRTLADVIAICVLMVINLRGVREAGRAFIVPTFVFVLSLGLLLVVGGVEASAHDLHPQHTIPAATTGVTVLLILRAFAGGCTAMTGVEAIANGVPAFRRPESRNAATTLAALATLLGALFLGTVLLGRAIHAVPSDSSSVIAQIGMAVAPNSPLFYLVQLSAAAVLLLAANTSFNGFPRLAAVMARDSYLPHRFSHRGMRLAYSNGILAIGAAAIALVIAFAGSTHALIPLFAVGVFLCFTLSQAGMVVHWHHHRERGWRVRQAINGVGAVTTGIVTVIVAGAKFAEGAWIVLLLIPALVGLFSLIHAHYHASARELATVAPAQPPGPPRVVVPVRELNRATVRAVEYALSVTGSDHVVALHLAAEEDQEQTTALTRQWQAWLPTVPLQVETSPFREVLGPLMRAIDEHRIAAGGAVTVVLPEIVPKAWLAETLHNQLGLALKVALLHRDGVVVTSVPTVLDAEHTA